MRRNDEGPHQHLTRHMERAAAQFVDGLQWTGLEPNERLTRAVAERTIREARASYVREATDSRDQHIQEIISDHTRRMNAIKRSGARLRLITCPPIALFFGLLAWYSFSQGGFVLDVCYVVGALAFLAMLFLGAIFDRPISH